MAPILPYDVLVHVVTHARSSRSTLAAVCLCSCDLHALALPRLYSAVCIEENQSRSLHLFLRSVDGNACLGRRITSLSIDECMPITLIPTFVAALRGMHNLRHLYCYDIIRVVTQDRSTLDAIAALSELRSIRLLRVPNGTFDLDDTNGEILDHLSTLEELYLDDSPLDDAVRRLMTRSIQMLTTLRIRADMDESLRRDDAKGLVWTRMCDLSVRELSSPLSARAFVNVERLSVSMPMLDVLHDPLCFPRLFQLSTCVPSIVPATAPVQRRIRHLMLAARSGINARNTRCLLDFTNSFHLPSLRSLVLDVGEGNLPVTTLTEILRQCTRLRYLGLTVTLPSRQQVHETPLVTVKHPPLTLLNSFSTAWISPSTLSARHRIPTCATSPWGTAPPSAPEQSSLRPTGR